MQKTNWFFQVKVDRMDKITHEVRQANWQSIIEQCQQRPDGQTAKDWLKDHDISEKSYYYWLRKMRKEVYEQMTASNLPAVNQESTVMFAEIPIQQANDSKFPSLSFQADTVIQAEKLTIGLSNSVSDNLLKQMMEVIVHVS